MSSESREVELSLKVYINRDNTKVLFAEGGNDFVDVLLSFMLLPLRRIVKVFEKEYGDNAPTIGSLTTLCNSLSNPNILDLWTERGKKVLNDPAPRIYVKFFSNLKISVDDTLPTTYTLGKPYNAILARNSASFLISDDLLIVPNLKESLAQTLTTLGLHIADLQRANIRDVTIGSKQVVDLLKGSLISQTPLSDLVLNTRHTKVATIKSEPIGISLYPAQEEAPSDDKRIILKVMFQKSTNKLLFAQANDDFVDFLFIVLRVQLARVVRFLGGNTCLTNIDNVNRSLAYHIDHNFVKTRFTVPEVDYNLYSLKNFLSINYENSPASATDTQIYVTEGSGMFMVTDDLSVTRLNLSSVLSLLHQMDISASDVEEVEIQIGYQEALSILKASLTSTCALSDALINPKLKKQPIQIQKILNQKRQRDRELDEKKGSWGNHPLCPTTVDAFVE